MRGLTGLLTAVMVLFVALGASPAAARGAATANTALTSPGPGGGALTGYPAGGEARPTPDAGAVAPPGTGGVDLPHQDPGAWPGLIFIVALFTLALVLRGSRGRRQPPGPADRRRR